MSSNQITPLLRPSSKEATDLEVGAVVNSASIMVDEISDEKAQTCYDWTTGNPILLNRLSGLLTEAHNIWELSVGRVEGSCFIKEKEFGRLSPIFFTWSHAKISRTEASETTC